VADCCQSILFRHAERQRINEKRLKIKLGENTTKTCASVTLVREVDTDVPAFVASGYANDPIMANPTVYGFNDSIRKPFRMGELSELLNKHLKKPE
jgi:DNA-binding NtrC family response regulator